MVDLATKILTILAGLWVAVASYPELETQFESSFLAFLGAVSLGILAGALFYAVVTWLLHNRPRV